MANPFFSGRIPQDLKDQIDQHCAEAGETKTDVLVNALSAYVNHPVVRPSADVASLKGEERFKALEERLAALELSFKRFSFENNVIKLDNSKEFQQRDIDNVNASNNKRPDTISDKILDTDIVDNKLDNKYDNISNASEDVETRDYVETQIPLPLLETIEKSNDNHADNTDNNIEKSLQPQQDLLPRINPIPFENLITSELLSATGLRRNQIDNYKKRVTAKYKELEQPLEDKKLLESPKKIETTKPIMIHGYPYDLFYLGQNKSGINLWSAVPYDNNRYQRLSSQLQISDQVSTNLA